MGKILNRFKKIDGNGNSQFTLQNVGYKWFILANVMIGTFMAVLDATIVNVGLPKIMASFGVGIDKIEWVLTAYMLALALFLPTSGWLADRFGYKKIYFLGLLLFTSGSFLCGISNDENILIISRVIQGLGAGAVMPLGMAIVMREFPPKQRGIAMGFWSIAAAASVSFGPLIGGYLVDNYSWQLIFDVNVPIGIVGMFATVIIQKEYVNRAVRKFDIIGFISVSIFLPLVLYALTEGRAASNSQGWSAPYILVCFAISAVMLAIFITNELIVKEPLIDLRLLANRNFGISNLIMFIFGLGMFGSTFLLPLYLQNSLGYTAIQSGAVFLPVGIIQGAISPFVGIVSDRVNPKIPIIIGILLLTISFYINGYLSFLSEHSYIMLSLYIRGLGMGMIFAPLSAIALLEIPHEKMAQASGLFNTIRQVGGSFGVAILATVLSTRVIYHSQMYSEALRANSPAFRSTVAHLNGYIMHNVGSSAINSVKQAQVLLLSNLNLQAFVSGVDDDFLLSAVITLVCIIPILFLHGKKHLQKDKSVKVEKYEKIEREPIEI